MILPKSTDTINISILKRMKIFKDDGQWIAKSNGFDDESGPSTLPFEGDEEMDEDEDEPPPRPRSQRPSSSTSSFTEDHFNLLNGRIDSLTSSMEGLHYTAKDLRLTTETLQQSVDGMTSLLQALHSHLDAVIPPPPPPDF
ncbi:berberine bridge enzyme-like 13 [Abeliophyllum distichum]|uniref:Berberine bridge enzyme-like 13 n=1 Tax=Abeliophyllum distichum TaxID=126358 RepID=A0ABD1PP28_9LAMI